MELGRTFTLSIAQGVRGNESRTIYETQAIIQNLEELKRACLYDHTGGTFKDNHRSNKDFIQAEVLLMDLDNTHSEKPEDWITPELLHEKLSDVPFYIIYSRHHMKEKKKKAPRPKFHVYFPLSGSIRKASEIRKLKERLLEVIPEFDGGAKDAARFFYGVETPEGAFYDGRTCIDEYLAESSGIHEGERNDYIYQKAVESMIRHGEAKARRIFDAACEKCDPPLSVKEVTSTWRSALKWYKEIKEQLTEKKQTLTLETIEKILGALKISVRFNVITKELEVSDLPTDTPYAPKAYACMSNYTRKEVNKKLLPLFLTSYLKDRSYIFSDSFLLGSIEAIADMHRYNPVWEMIQGTTWDGENRLSKLYEVLGIRDNPFHCGFVAKWLWQALSLAFNDDGAVNSEFALVFQGAQGVGKTNFFRKLAVNPDWFREGAVIDMRNKDTIIESTSVWITELGEFDATAQKEQANLKSFLTSNYDTYRKPYGRKTERIERRTVFAATVNPEHVNRDSTGSRRFIYIHIDAIDKQFVYTTMTPEWCAQLWRQVYEELYVAGGRKGFYLTEAERKYAERSNEDFRVPVKGEQELLDMLDWTSESEGWSWYTATEVKDLYRELIQYSPVDISKALRKIFERFNLDMETYFRRSNGKRKYKLPNREPKYSYED